jgi:hypothetical protein
LNLIVYAGEIMFIDVVDGIPNADDSGPVKTIVNTPKQFVIISFVERQR